MKRAVFALCCLSLFAWTSPVRAEKFHFDGLVKGAKDAYAKVDDYVCNFHKKERIKDHTVEEVILFKFRKKPASYYMKWLKSADEAIYVEGRNNDQLLYHEGGLLNVVAISIDPYGPLAMRDHRHAITDAGLGHILGVVVENYQRAKTDPRSKLTYEGEAIEEGRTVLKVRAEFPTADYYSHIIQIRFDRATGLPIWFRVEGWEGEFLEEYSFSDLKLNVGLTDKDFDPHNPEYKFGWVLP